MGITAVETHVIWQAIYMYKLGRHAFGGVHIIDEVSVYAKIALARP